MLSDFGETKGHLPQLGRLLRVEVYFVLYYLQLVASVGIDESLLLAAGQQRAQNRFQIPFALFASVRIVNK